MDPGPNVAHHGKVSGYKPSWARGYLWVSYPQESLKNTRNNNKYHGYKYVNGVHPSLSLDKGEA